MSNPFFSRSTAFKEGGHAPGTAPAQTPNGYPTMPGYQAGQYGQQASGYGQQYGQYSQYGQAAGQYGNQYGQQVAGYGQVTPEQMAGLETQYQAPSATNADMRRMTYDDVIIRTAGMFAVILATGALSWSLVTSSDEATFSLGAMAVFAGAIGAFVLGLVNSFKREPSPALILAYAAFEGLLLGGFSGIMEARYEGIVVQAVLATLATFGAMLAAYSFGGFRVQGRFRRVVVVATFGYMIFSLINFVLMVTGATTGAWGLRSLTIMGIPLGVPLGILAVILASFFLAIDFESIENGVRNGLPRRYAWAGAFGLVVTLVWLYVEFLRLLSYFRD
jgi:hypothetical protein